MAAMFGFAAARTEGLQDSPCARMLATTVEANLVLVSKEILLSGPYSYVIFLSYPGENLKV